MTAPGRPSAFVALRHRNFRLLWSSQLVSNAGSMMQSAAILWHVSLLVPPDRRGLALGLVGLVRVVPIVVFSLVSGVVADAHDRRRLMLLTQTGMALAAGALAWVAFRGSTGVWPIYLLAALSSAFWAFDGPARQSLIPNLVPREHLQLGELEAGLVAQLWGAPFSVITGGLGCVLATAWIAWRTPALREYRREAGAGERRVGAAAS